MINWWKTRGNTQKNLLLKGVLHLMYWKNAPIFAIYLTILHEWGYLSALKVSTINPHLLLSWYVFNCKGYALCMRFYIHVELLLRYREEQLLKEISKLKIFLYPWFHLLQNTLKSVRCDSLRSRKVLNSTIKFNSNIFWPNSVLEETNIRLAFSCSQLEQHPSNRLHASFPASQM